MLLLLYSTVYRRYKILAQNLINIFNSNKKSHKEDIKMKKSVLLISFALWLMSSCTSTRVSAGYDDAYSKQNPTYAVSYGNTTTNATDNSVTTDDNTPVFDNYAENNQSDSGINSYSGENNVEEIAITDGDIVIIHEYPSYSSRIRRFHSNVYVSHDYYDDYYYYGGWSSYWWPIGFINLGISFLFLVLL